MIKNRALPLLALLAVTPLLPACAPILLGGAAVSGVMLYSDRRTSGAQVEDQSIENKAAKQIHALIGDRCHVSAVSYNRIALLTGEVPTEADRAAIEKSVAGIENLRSVVNEIAVMTSSTLTSRSNDLLLTSKVRATFLDAGSFEGKAFKLVTERGTVFLMGRVTAAEADRAAELARSVSGVQKVVRVVELISPEELRALQSTTAPANAPQTAPRP